MGNSYEIVRCKLFKNTWLLQKSNTKAPPLNPTSLAWKQIVKKTINYIVHIHTNSPPRKISRNSREIVVVCYNSRVKYGHILGLPIKYSSLVTRTNTRIKQNLKQLSSPEVNPSASSQSNRSYRFKYCFYIMQAGCVLSHDGITNEDTKKYSSAIHSKVCASSKLRNAERLISRWKCLRLAQC